MKKIFVTGSEGFVGSHLVDRLLSEGYYVKALVLYNSFNNLGWLKNSKKKKNLQIVLGDIRDRVQIENHIKDCKIVFHLASLIGIPYSYQSVQSYLETNVSGTINILNSCRKSKIEKIILTSTSEIYGTCQFNPMSENHPKVPQSPYAASKLAADNFSISYFKSFNLPITILRPFNIFGPRQSLRAIIPTIINQHLSKSKKIYLGNVNTFRDFTYVEDTIDAFVKTAKLNNKKIIGEEINIGSGFCISIAEINDLVEKILNSKKKIIIQKNRVRPAASEVSKLISDNTKAKKLLKWKSKIRNKRTFKLFLEKTITWFIDNQTKNQISNKEYIV